MQVGESILLWKDIVEANLNCDISRLTLLLNTEGGDPRSQGMFDCSSHVPYEYLTSKELLFIKSVEKDLEQRLRNPSSTPSLNLAHSNLYPNPLHSPSSDYPVSIESLGLGNDMFSTSHLISTQSGLFSTNNSYSKDTLEGVL